MIRVCRSSLLVLLLIGFAVSSHAQTSSAERSATGTERSDSKVSSRGRTPRFELKEHPRLVVGRALLLNFEGKFDVDSGVVSREIDNESQLDLGRRRLGLSGSLFDVVDFQIEREIGDHKDPWRDVFAGVRVTKSLDVRAGKFKTPYSRAQLTSLLKLDFINRPLAATALSPGRRVGAMAEGSVLRKRLNYQAGLFRAERSDERVLVSSPPANDRPLIATRLVARPFRKRLRMLDGLEVGIAGGTEHLAEGLVSVAGRTVVDRSWFFREMYVKGRRLRRGYEVSWAPGPLTLVGEYLQVNDERREQGVRGQDLPDLVARGWYVSASWRVFGDRRTEDLPLGVAPFTKRKGGLELAARLEQLRFGSHAPGEPAFRNPRAAQVLGNSDRALTFGVNWYMSRFARVQCNVIGERVADVERSPIGSTERFWSAVTRLQLHL